jgi:hypothetical protein
LDAQQRSACWAGVREILVGAILTAFEEKVLTRLNGISNAYQDQLPNSKFPEAIDLMRATKEIFTSDTWDASSLDKVRHTLESGVIRAAEFGLLHMLQTTRREGGIVGNWD